MTKPLIGICMDHVRHFPAPDRDRSYLKLYPQYCHVVLAAGGTPLLLPVVPDVAALRPLLGLVSGLMLVGSDDYPADWFGKTTLPTDTPVTAERAKFDREFIRVLLEETSLPVLGVCGGMQLMAIHAGGALVQDLPRGGEVEHRQPANGVAYHDIDIQPGSVFAGIYGTRTRVNTMHHQAVERVGVNQRVSARAPDGVIEALEHTDHPFRIGVQWHPERMLDDERSLALFRALIRASQTVPVS
jgi:putative glutamine amidotransferase